MKRDEIKALAERQAAKARQIAKAGQIARPAEPAKPAEATAAAPERPALRVYPGGRLGSLGLPAQSAPAPSAGRRLKISDRAVEIAKARGRKADLLLANPFSAAKPPPGVLPKGKKLAMDDAFLPGVTWANQAYVEGAWFEGMEFPGYAYLGALMQRTEYRRAAERLATEMTRKWIKLTSTGDEDKTEKIQQLDNRLKELKLKECCQKLALTDNAFGRAHLYIDTGDTDDPAELRTPIGDGRNRYTRSKIKKGSIERLRVIEPIWCYPAKYDAQDPLRPDWYTPTTWFCMGKEIHASRLLPFIGREVPDILKPSYSFGGLSLTQMLKPYVDNWLDNRQSIARLISRFSTSGIKTDMQQQIAPDPSGASGQGMSTEDFFKRMDLFVQMAKNEGLLVLDKNMEEFFQFNVPLGTLDQLQAQSQEQICSAAGIPVVVLLGLTPHGLNASSEGEIRAFEDWVAAYQPHFYGDRLQRLIDFAMIDLWGEVDEEIGYEWVPLHSLDEKGQADVEKTKSDVDVAFVNAGVLDPLEVRKRLASDPSSGYSSIDVDDVPEQPGGEPGGEGGPGGEEGAFGEGPFEAEPENDNEPPEGKNSRNSKFSGTGQDDEPEGVRGYPFAEDAAEWVEHDHPREKDGKFTAGSGSNIGAPIKQEGLKRVGKQMGSNPGGVYENEQGGKFYVKKGKSRDHVRNEMLAARLYGMAGSPTLKYRPVEGGQHIATEMQKLDKTHAHQLSPEELKKAREELAIHAWLSNWDAVGLENDNLGSIGGTPTSLDLGGALTFRAQGTPKGKLFGPNVTEMKTLRDPHMNPQSARVFGKASQEEIAAGAKRVLSIPDAEIRAAVEEHGGTPELADKLIARKRDIGKQTGLLGSQGDPKKPDSTVTFSRDEKPVKELNGVKFEKWTPPADQDWNEVEGQADLGEDPLPARVKGKRLASGVVIREKDGRTWLMQPKGGYGGYNATFPKGGVEGNLSMQANAIKEAWEETGLKVKIVGHAGDAEGDTSFTRYYLAEREAGDPSEHGEETEGVVLAPPNALENWLNRSRDRKLAKSVGEGSGAAQPEIAEAASAYKEHAAVNDWLRGDRSPASGSAEENEPVIKGMDKLIASNKLSEPKTLYRGYGDLDLAKALEKGRGYIRDKAFLSTSSDEATAKSFAGGGYVAKIEVPAGTPAYQYQGDHQGEVVLPRDTKLKVVGVDHGKRRVTLKVVDAPAKGAEDALSVFKIGDDFYLIEDEEDEKQAKDESNFEESKHPRVHGGKNAGQFAPKGGSGGGGPAAGEKPKTKTAMVAEMLKHGTTMAEFKKVTGWTNIHNPALAAGMKVVKSPDGTYKGVPMTPEELAAAKAAKKAKKTGAPAPSGEKLYVQPMKPKAPESKKSDFPSPAVITHKDVPTAAEMEKAKKNVALQLSYVPGEKPTLHEGQQEAQKLVNEFNQKYEGKTLTSQADLSDKVKDFKVMQAKIAALAKHEAAHKAELEAKQKESLAKAQKELAEKSKAQAEQAKETNALYMKELGISEKEAQGFAGLLQMLGGTTQKELIAQFKQHAEQAKSALGAASNISGFEAALIANYKGSSNFVNSELRKPAASWSPQQWAYSKVLNKALSKIPAYKGETIRNTPLSAELQQRYLPGKIVMEHGFTGTSKKKPKGVFSGNTRFYVTSIGQRAADISSAFGFFNEQEVLFRAHTAFHVDKVEGVIGSNGEASYKVWMTEVEHE